MNAKSIPVPQRGLLLLIAVGLLTSGVVFFLGQRVPHIQTSSGPIVLRDVAIILPTFHDAQPIDVNTASLEELDLLPGIGPALAARIIAHRAAHGSFASIDDLVAVDGIGPQTVEGLRDRATTGAETVDTQ